LKSPDAQVRYLAAEKLAEDGVQEAVPSIAEALSTEEVPATRVNIAFALALLGDEKGVSSLKAACGDADVPGYLRIRAARYLLDLHNEDCMNAVLGMLDSNADPDSQTQALSVLPSFQHVSQKDSQRIFDVVVRALEDPTPAVRITASVALGALGNPSALPYLQTAIANERDEVVRSQLESTVRDLRQRREHTE
jgi:HEAT repeat protein